MTEQLVTSKVYSTKLNIYTKQYTITCQDPISLPVDLIQTTFSTPQSVG
jgi:hypothetical protein